MEELWKLIAVLTDLAPFATLAAIYIIYRVLMNVRENDLQHIDEKIEGVQIEVANLGHRMDLLFDRERYEREQPRP